MSRFYGGMLLAVFAALFSAMTGFGADAAPAEQFVVYYPHTTFRCHTCNLIETLTKTAIEGGTLQAADGKEIVVDNASVAELLKSNKLVFRSVNVDEPEQATLLTELKTKAKMPALAKVVNGKIVAAQPLDGAWKMLAQPDAYCKYVQSSVLDFMKKNK